MTQDTDDDEYFLPLEDQRVFGAGIKRKRVPFVPSSETSLHSTSLSAPATPGPFSSSKSGTSVADKYLSIVLSSGKPTDGNTTTPDNDDASKDTPTTTTATTVTCDICNLPLSSKHPHPHESSLAHQLSLPHSHPPSSIDRSRVGYKYLSAYGWDPDSRRGLGAAGQGIRVPLKTRGKNDTVGLGVRVPKGEGRVVKKMERKLGAKEVRRMEEEGKKRGERLREMFYRGEEVVKYLGE